MKTNYLILVNTARKIPADYIDSVELVEMRGYDDEIFRAEKQAAAHFCGLQKASAQAGMVTPCHKGVRQ